MGNANSGFVERTLIDINQALERTWFADRIARQPGLLQSLDPRVKILAALLLLVVINLSRNLIGIASIFPLILLLAALSRIPLFFFIRRIWWLAFLFTGILALPALFLTPGPTLFTLLPGIAITRNGLQTAVFLWTRTGASISLAALAVLTTPWNSFLRALGVLRIPDVIVLILGMTYRYIHLLLHTAYDMFLARKSRLLRTMDAALERKLLGGTIGVLLGKSLELSGDVYLAMLSRGYRGYPRTIETLHVGWRDACAGGIVLLFSFLILRGI